ncbi:ZIP family metal transporter [Pontibacillus salipaludis]|uniref:ZIP family metal transporter n=1 Tax=Pontibacillus salipaludis TaxID=1697394 RepID=A0ABQ1Q7A3_9BACI|nr:ZIP family metal transporter [Pontibacillus salipaludis]GGD15260.1 ZIP family metal transporter [Pontibacillus salipaludis]
MGVEMISMLVASLCTLLGALPVLLIKNLSHKGRDVLLAYTAGVMVAASTYGLIPSALKLSNVPVLITGILVGTVVLMLLEILLPHQDLEHEVEKVSRSSILLFIIAMSLHNVPEGLSVGISFASDYRDLGSIVAFVIGLQNMPEGFLVALFLLLQKVHQLKMMILVSVTALVELLAAIVGMWFGQFFSNVIPYGLAFSAGAMLFIVYKELIPESHGDGNERVATLSFIFGFISMIFLTDIMR